MIEEKLRILVIGTVFVIGGDIAIKTTSGLITETPPEMSFFIGIIFGIGIGFLLVGAFFNNLI